MQDDPAMRQAVQTAATADDVALIAGTPQLRVLQR